MLAVVFSPRRLLVEPQAFLQVLVVWGGKALEVGRRLWSGVGGAGQTGAMIGAGAGALGGAAAGLRKDQQGHRSILGGITGGLHGGGWWWGLWCGSRDAQQGLPAAQAQLGILKNTVMPKGTGAGVSLSGSQGMPAHLPTDANPSRRGGYATGASIPTPIPAGGTAASNVNMWGAPETEGRSGQRRIERTTRICLPAGLKIWGNLSSKPWHRYLKSPISKSARCRLSTTS